MWLKVLQLSKSRTHRSCASQNVRMALASVPVASGQPIARGMVVGSFYDSTSLIICGVFRMHKKLDGLFAHNVTLNFHF